jgi:endonuclease/exonuclease/phosphatase family metal-dependent hydrolase
VSKGSNDQTGNLRIMVYNVGYLTGITGQLLDYLSKGSFFFLRHAKKRGATAEQLAQLVEEIDPDILFLSEVKNQDYMKSVTSLFAAYTIDSKYEEGSIFESLPFFRGNCNAVFFKRPQDVEKMYFTHGAKKLLYRVAYNEQTDFFFAHFALGRKTRKKQFQELAAHAQNKSQVIVGGDFNIFNGVSEVAEMARAANIKIITDEDTKTFPSLKPVHNIDLFLASPSITLKQVRVLSEVLLSDHLPIVADFEL